MEKVAPHPATASAYGIIARTWMPLALNWLMMALEGPLLVALIGRLADPTGSLATFSVAFAIALIVEAPIMMLLSASAALVNSRADYEKLWRFGSALALPLSGLMAVIGLPSVFERLNALLWHLPPLMSQRVAGAVWLLIPWPAAIAYRRLWQGILIRTGRSRLVAWGTVLRLVGMGIGAMGALWLTDWSGAWIAACALSAGVLTEMLAVRLWAAPTLRHLPSTRERHLSYRQIASFYFPLLLTSILNVALTPLLTLLMAHGHDPILSLASYSPTTSTIFLFSCFGVAYQEVVIVLSGTRVNASLLPFAHRIALGTMAGLALLILPGIYDFWFGQVFSLPAALHPLARIALLCALPMPGLMVYLAYIKGRFIWAQHTRINLLAAVVELSSVTAFAGGLILGTSLTALYGAIIGLVAARALTLGIFFRNFFAVKQIDGIYAENSV